MSLLICLLHFSTPQQLPSIPKDFVKLYLQHRMIEVTLFHYAYSIENLMLEFMNQGSYGRQANTKAHKHTSKQAHKQTILFLSTQARFLAAMKLMLAFSSTSCVLRVASEYSVIDFGRLDSRAGCWLLVCSASDGI